MLCAAVPAAIFLLALFAAMTVTRLKNPTSPNADLLASQLESLGDDTSSAEEPRSASTSPAHF